MTATIDLLTTPTYADARLAMMQAGDARFDVTVLGAVLGCDCDGVEHPVRWSSWVAAVESFTPGDRVDPDQVWWRARVHDAVRDGLEVELEETLRPATADAVRAGVEWSELWLAQQAHTLDA